ncbi:MAG: chemotaxis protein CheA, partial [Paraburkholderia sp.]
MSHDDDLSRRSLLDLFREEAQTQTRVLSGGLLALEHAPSDAAQLEACMRAAHSLKGAARIIGLQDGVDIAHLMEECFVAAQRGALQLSAAHIDELLRGVDLLLRAGEADPAGALTRAEVDAFVARLAAFSAVPGAAPGGSEHAGAGQDWSALLAANALAEPAANPFANSFANSFANPFANPFADPSANPDDDATMRAALAILGADAAKLSASPAATAPAMEEPASEFPAGGAPAAEPPLTPAPSTAPPVAGFSAAQNLHGARDPERMLRVRADNLDRLLSLSGESLVESRWLKPFAESLLRVKRTHRDAARALDTCYETLAERLEPQALAALDAVRQTLGTMQHLLATRIDELDRFDRRSSHLAQQLYDEALQCRMRPFGDATHAYPRIVRDLARSLGKRVRFSIVGESTQIDRDILDMLDAPLGHLLRNALDHGVEAPEVRLARGKSAEATLTLEARHSAGKLLISVSDDASGVDLDALRDAIVRRQLADWETAARLSDQALLDFLLLPGFSMRAHVTDVSGRGVGLDAVHEMVKAVRGTVRIVTEPGHGTRFVLQLPLTLSVIRSLLVEVGGEAYAFPLAHVR